MTRRRACPPAPGPLEEYARQFDELWRTLAQRRGFREYLQGLLLPRDRNKTLTALVGTEPIVGAHAAPVQALQFFLSESTWDPEAIHVRRLELLLTDPATRPHDGGVLVLDDSGDRKAGMKTAHVGRQYLGSIGKVDNGIVAVTSLWADERVYYPLHTRPLSWPLTLRRVRGWLTPWTYISAAGGAPGRRTHGPPSFKPSSTPSARAALFTSIAAPITKYR